MDTISEYLCHEWVDEVFVKISETEPYPQKLIDEIITMGLTVHLSLGEMEKSLSGKNFIEKIGGYSVITSSINTASPKQLLYKRLMDIAGGIVGCLLTVILIVVIGPMIYIKSPGRSSSHRCVSVRTERNLKSINSAACIWMPKREKQN